MKRNRSRLIGLVLALVTITGACGIDTAPPPAATTQPTAVPPPGPVLTETGEDLPVPFSYYLREAQIDWGWRIFKLFLYSVGGNKNHSTFASDDWSSDNMVVEWRFHDNDRTYQCRTIGCRYVHFYGFSFDPDGDFVYGKTQVHSQTPKEYGGVSYLLDAEHSEEPLPFHREETVEREQERSTETTKTVEQDIEIKAGQKGTIGGEGVGASLELSLEETWGVSNSEETSRAEAESKSVSQTVSIDYEGPAGRKTLLLVETTTADTSTPAHVSAAMMYDKIVVHWTYTLASKDLGKTWYYLDGAGWWTDQVLDHRNKGVHTERYPGAPYTNDTYCSGGKRCVDYAFTFTFDGLDDMIEKFSGKSPDWPGTLDKKPPGYVHHWIESVYDRDNRNITLDFVQRRKADGVVDFTAVDVTGQKTDDILDQHGIAEDNVVTGP